LNSIFNICRCGQINIDELHFVNCREGNSQFIDKILLKLSNNKTTIKNNIEVQIPIRKLPKKPYSDGCPICKCDWVLCDKDNHIIERSIITEVKLPGLPK